VTEIPQHLLDRTRSRRQALGLAVSGGDGGGAATGAAAPAAAAGGGGGGGGVAVAKGPVAPSGGVERPKAAPKPPAPYEVAYQRRKKIPAWAMPVVAFLPIWAFLYAGTLEAPKSTNPTLLEAGAGVYAGAAGCSGCHGASGGGGVGPQLSGGRLAERYPNPVDQVRWIALGSADPRGKALFETNGAVSKGGMPGYGKTLSLKEIVEAVLHTRYTLSGLPLEDDAEAWAELRALPEEFPEFSWTAEDVDMILEEIAAENGIEIPAE